MHVGESQAFLAEFQRDLAAETNPALQAWYAQELKLQPEYAEAEQTNQTLGRLAIGLQRLVELKSEGAVAPDKPADAPNSMEILAPERPLLLTAEEQLQQRFQKKYDRLTQQFHEGLSELQTKPIKSSKRVYQERLLRRRYIHGLTDLSDITGDEHLVVRADLLGWICGEVITDAATAREVFADCAEYAAKHGAVVTKRSESFAALIRGSLPGNNYAKDYDSILASIFISGHNQADYIAIHRHLGDAAFLLLEDNNAVQKLVNIVDLKEPYMPSTYGYKTISTQIQALLDGDLQTYIDHGQLYVIFEDLRRDVLGQTTTVNPKMDRVDADMQQLFKRELLRLRNLQSHDESDAFRLAMLDRLLTTGFDFLDPVAVNDLRSDQTTMSATAPVDPLFDPFINRSSLYRNRLRDIAPYTYAIKTAKSLLGAGVDAFSAPISPSLSVDIFTQMKGTHTTPPPDVHQRLLRQLSERLPAILSAASDREASGISSYEASGTLGLAWQPLFTDVKDGIIIIRPAIPSDKNNDTGLQQLMLAHFEDTKAANKAGRTVPSAETLVENNEALRATIQQNYKRFLGRRPVQFQLPSDTARGLRSIALRFDAKAGVTKCAFDLADGTIELTMDRDFRIQAPGSESHPTLRRIMLYYENLVLRSAQAWMCQPAVYTSEGVVSDDTGNAAANLGHFSYLRLLGNGRKASYSQEQRLIFLQEQGRDLAAESQRLAALDPSGLGRNSTYVREYYDPTKPPLIVYPS